jgi:hypothetical protein
MARLNGVTKTLFTVRIDVGAVISKLLIISKQSRFVLASSVDDVLADEHDSSEVVVVFEVFAFLARFLERFLGAVVAVFRLQAARTA